MKISGNKILITGGASGIGLGLATRFLQEGNKVIICGRRKSVLDNVSSMHTSIVTRSCDLSNANEREKLYKWISEEHPDTNVLINNAGIQQWMSVKDADFFARAREEMIINIEAPLHLTALFVNLKSIDTVINVTSGLSFVPMSRMPVYCASKAFLHSFTLSLRHMIKPVEVIELIPPALNTDLGGKGLHNNAPPVSEFIDAAFMQLKAGKNEISYGFSEQMANSSPEELTKAFNRMNNV